MFLWILLGAIYIAALIFLGVATLRKGHFILFFVGIIFPILWIFGALMGPTARASAGRTPPSAGDAHAGRRPAARPRSRGTSGGRSDSRRPRLEPAPDLGVVDVADFHV